jgi:hypothetical protein
MQALIAAEPGELQAWLAAHRLSIDAVVWLRGQSLAPYAYHRLQKVGLVASLAPVARDELRQSYRVYSKLVWINQQSTLSGGPQPVVEGCGAVWQPKAPPSTPHGAGCGSHNAVDLVRRAPLRMPVTNFEYTQSYHNSVAAAAIRDGELQQVCGWCTVLRRTYWALTNRQLPWSACGLRRCGVGC